MPKELLNGRNQERKLKTLEHPSESIDDKPTEMIWWGFNEHFTIKKYPQTEPKRPGGGRLNSSIVTQEKSFPRYFHDSCYKIHDHGVYSFTRLHDCVNGVA